MDDTIMDDGAMDGSAIPDAAIMDANIDDLFGEATDGLGPDALGVPLPAAPLPPRLVLRIAEMQTSGCCTKLAWSNVGSIAQISDDGHKIVFRALIRNVKSSEWSMTPESEHSIPAPEGTKWEHIQFSSVGIDLAAVDTQGSVYVYTLVGALSKMTLAPSNINRDELPRSDNDAVVGLHWLPVAPAEFRVPYITAANKIGDKWVTGMRHRDRNEVNVHHAADNRHAFLHISRDTKLTLMYQIEAVWNSISTNLETINSSNELLSHAAFGEEGSHLLLVTHDISRRFRLYRVTINWNSTQQARGPNLPSFTTVAPALEIARLTILDHVAAQHADAARLSHLQLLSPVPNVAADPNTPTVPTVLAVFTRASLPLDPTQQTQEAFSVIARWHTESVQPALHEAFTRLKSNTTSKGPETQTVVLRRQEDLITNKIVMSVELQHYNTMLAFIGSDGTLEFRDRVTMTSIEPYGDTTTVSSLPQSGFEHIMGAHNLHLAISSDGSAMVTTTATGAGTLTHKLMALRYSWHPIEEDSLSPNLVEAAVVCLARQYAQLSCASHTTDEVLALIPTHLSAELRLLFVRQVMRMTVLRTIDVALVESNKQSIVAIKEAVLPRSLSAQLVVGVEPESMKPAFGSKFAFTFLNMRLVAQGLSVLVSGPNAAPVLLTSLRGVVRWGADMLVYVCSQLIPLKRKHDPSSTASTKKIFEAFATNEGGNPILGLLLATYTRVYLRFFAGVIQRYLAFAQRLTSQANSVLERQQLVDVLEFATGLPVRYKPFEEFIIEIDGAIRTAYSSPTVPMERRAEIEIEVMTSPLIPPELEPVVDTIWNSALPKLIENTDLTKLHFYDTSWLGLGVNENAVKRKYDILRKILLTEGMILRTCRRCGSVMEDLKQEKLREVPGWLIHAQRHCVCGNYWVSLGDGKGSERNGDES